MQIAARILERFLRLLTTALLMVLTVVVVASVVARYFFNSSFVWYDEVASVLLAWITFYGGAYAALLRRHLGFEGLLAGARPTLRMPLFALGEAVFYAVFACLAWAGWVVLGIMGSETLISLDWVPLWLTQSAVPVSALLFMLGHALSTPETLARLRAGRTAEEEEMQRELERASVAAGESRRP